MVLHIANWGAGRMEATMDIELYDELVDGIYGAAVAPEQWPAVLKNFNAAFNSHLAGFFVQTSANQFGESLFEGFAPEMAKTYAQHYSTVNPWFIVPNLMGPGRVLTDRSLETLHADRRAYVNTEYYQDWARLGDMRHGIGGTLRNIDGGLLNFTLFRTRTAGYYTDEEIRLCTLLSSHLMKATAIGAQFALLTKEKLDRNHALDQLRLGVIVLDGQARILHLNSYARRLLNTDDTLYETKSQIKARPVQNADALCKALGQLELKPKASALNLPRTGKSPLSVCILPGNEQRGFLGLAERSFTLFISDPDDRKFSGKEIIAQKWRLTERESDFALRLARGLSIKQIATELELTQNSAQWYCKQIMQKVGVKRQAELCIKLVMDLSLLVDA
jgi:DNA-binding CsgD family transcriptional regulator